MGKNKAKSEIFGYRELMLVLDIPGPLAQKLAEVSETLSKVADPVHIDAFWIPPELMHLTMLNLGQVREDLIEYIQDQLKKLLSSRKTFSITLKKTMFQGAEGDEGEPRAIWAGVEDGSGQLARLHEDLRRVFEGMEQETFSQLPFTPHIPLALLNRYRNTREFDSALVEVEDQFFGKLDVKALVLLENLAPSGERKNPFQTLARIEIKGNQQQ